MSTQTSPTGPAASSLYLRGILLAAAGMIVISPDGMLIRLVEHAPMWDILFWRTFGTGVALLVGLCLVYRGRLIAVLRQQGRAGVMSSGLLALANVFFLFGMLNTSVANTLVIMATMPFWSAILGLVLIGEAVSRRTWMAIAVALAGIGIIVSDSMTIGGTTLLGDLSALACAMCHGLNLVVLRKAGDRDMTPALMFSGFLTALVCVPLMQPSAVPADTWWVLALLGLGVLPVALGLFLAGARYAPAAEVALLSLVETVLGPLWAWLVVSEEPGPRALIGGGLVVVAVAGNAVAGLAMRRRRGRRAAAEVVPPPPH